MTTPLTSPPTSPPTSPSTSRLTSPWISELRAQRPASRLLGRHGLFWLVFAIFHAVVFVVSDTAWVGAVSFRKPIVFALSFSLMMWAFGWTLDRLPDRPKMAGRLAKTFVWSSAFEMILITAQAWRGRPSHFAVEGVDGVVFSLMGATVVVISLSILVLFGWAIRRAPKDKMVRLAMISGLVMIISGLGVGQWIITLGTTYVEQYGEVPETVIAGEAGVAKFPHAIGFHGMQTFMIAAALLRRSGASARRALNTMRVVVASYAGILVFSVLQSYGGRAPLDIDVISGVLLTVCTVVLAGAFASMLPRRTPSTGVPAHTGTSFAA